MKSISSDDVILSINPGHDGAVALLKDSTLEFSKEAEHDSKPRHWPVGAYQLISLLDQVPRVPIAICISGWSNEYPFQTASAPYYGVDSKLARFSPFSMFGHETLLFESTHERAHVFCSYGLSPIPQGEPCYVLVWEGNIGSFYEIDECLGITQLGPVLRFPGYKYSFLYDLADPTCEISTWRLDNAGKLMALSGFSQKSRASKVDEMVIARILDSVVPPLTDKKQFADTEYINCGITDSKFQDLVRLFSERLFEIFHQYAMKHLRKGYPLLISGGCGLNCEWNSRWKSSGLFRDVFVPPVTNDAGTSIGTAIEAQYLLSGNAKIDWSVYSGSNFVMDIEQAEGFRDFALNYEGVASLLRTGLILAWVQGKCEIGPRALGNRSILAAPFKRSTTDRLNKIKQREWYRPIAPVCLEEEARDRFGLVGNSPYMLYFTKVKDRELQAVTHVDGSARVQTVSRTDNEPLYQLLSAFKRQTGYGVLCNTSLNLKGRGFINRASDLLPFVIYSGIDGAVIGSRVYLRFGIDVTGDAAQA
jgi:hydroxymethyl cephem carbamoyltransferase